jgi:hypothetical protein
VTLRTLFDKLLEDHVFARLGDGVYLLEIDLHGLRR